MAASVSVHCIMLVIVAVVVVVVVVVVVGLKFVGGCSGYVHSKSVEMTGWHIYFFVQLSFF